MDSTSPSHDWVELIRGLNAADAKYLIVGAHAVGLYGTPRATGDLDIWIERSEANAKLVYRVLVDFGAPLTGLTEADLQSDDCVFMFGRPPVRIDILTDISGVSFEDAWPNREYVVFLEIPAAFIGRDDLIKNKRASGRTKDLADLEVLEES
jgi:hypothetical protein